MGLAEHEKGDFVLGGLEKSLSRMGNGKFVLGGSVSGDNGRRKRLQIFCGGHHCRHFGGRCPLKPPIKVTE